MAEPENPSAFPVTAIDPWKQRILHSEGMTLRDWFAGQALAGYFSHPTTPHMNATDAASYCFAMADAMLIARAQGKAF